MGGKKVHFFTYLQTEYLVQHPVKQLGLAVSWWCCRNRGSICHGDGVGKRAMGGGVELDRVSSRQRKSSLLGFYTSRVSRRQQS